MLFHSQTLINSRTLPQHDSILLYSTLPLSTSLSPGITSLLDTAMSSLHLNLPGNTRPVSTPQNTKQHPHTFKNESSGVRSLDNDIEKRIEQIESILRSKNKENVIKNIEGETISSTINKKDIIEINKNNENKDDNYGNVKSHISDPTKEYLDTKYKLESIDKILGFDAEKDKNSYFSGQLKNQNLNNNIGENGFRGNITELRNSVGSSNLNFNPNFKPNRNFPIGKFSHFSPFSGAENERMSRQNEPKLVFAGDVSPSPADRDYGRSVNNNYDNNSQNNNNNNSNNNNNNNISNIGRYYDSNPLNRSKRNILTVNFDGDSGSNGQMNQPNSLPSAPPIYPRNLTQDPSPSREVKQTEMARKFIDSSISSRKMDLEQRSYAAFDAKFRNQKEIYNEIKTEIGSDSRIRGNSLFSPPSFPPEGSAIRALRSTQKEKIRNENSLDPGSLRKESRNSISPEQFRNNKENIFQNQNIVLPDFSSPVHDRQEYLNKMKKMRELLTAQ